MRVILKDNDSAMRASFLVRVFTFDTIYISSITKFRCGIAFDSTGPKVIDIKNAALKMLNLC